jgi:hypothetical protein
MMEGPPQAGKQPLESKDVMKKEALAEIDRFIEKEVDVKALRSIYEERYREAGLDPALLNFPLGDSKNRVFQTNKEVAHMGGTTLGEDASGYYIPVVKKISIDIESPQLDPDDNTPRELKDLRNDVHDKIETLHHLIHESTHAASDWGKGIENGFSRSFRALNEAVTERLAQEITLQHIRKTNFAGGLDAWRPVSERRKIIRTPCKERGP